MAETVKASIGFYSKQKRLTSLALQVSTCAFYCC